MLEINNYAEVTYIDPDENGLINQKSVRNALKRNTVLVSVAYANNEIGTIQPIMEIAKAIRHFRKNNNSTLPFFHTDACQAMNYLETSNIEKLGVDMMSFNSSKIYGPKAIGALYKKRNIQLNPLYLGGGQEFGLRSGTEDVSLITGFAKALEIASKIKVKESKRLINIRDYTIKKLLALSNKVGDFKIILNGDEKNRLPNNINISISGISSELLVVELDAKGIEVSSKSACKSDEPDESYVISAIRKAQGIDSNSVEGSIRITLGRGTLKSDIDKLVITIKDILNKCFLGGKNHKIHNNGFR
jgi:cysteine desulfurase